MEQSVPCRLVGGKIKKNFRGVGSILSQRNILVKNLGLSLTDYYWIRPLDSELTRRRGEGNCYE